MNCFALNCDSPPFKTERDLVKHIYEKHPNFAFVLTENQKKLVKEPQLSKDNETYKSSYKPLEIDEKTLRREEKVIEKMLKKIEESDEPRDWYCFDVNCSCPSLKKEKDWIKHMMSKHKDLEYVLTERQKELFKTM